MENSHFIPKNGFIASDDSLISYNNAPIFTSLVFTFSFFFDLKNNYKNLIYTYFSSITFNASIISILFWSNPEKNRNSLIHQIDAISARYVIINYGLYELFFSNDMKNLIITSSSEREKAKSVFNLFLFFSNYFLMLYFFYLSNKQSSLEWCSKSHLKAHINAHMHAIICLFVVLYNLTSNN